MVVISMTMIDLNTRNGVFGAVRSMDNLPGRIGYLGDVEGVGLYVACPKDDHEHIKARNPYKSNEALASRIERTAGGVAVASVVFVGGKQAILIESARNASKPIGTLRRKFKQYSAA